MDLVSKWTKPMGEFISRKQLEVRHSRSYEMRGRLKQLGCEWDPIARAWIAPSLEVQELIYQELEEREQQDESIRRPFFGQCSGSWASGDMDDSHGALPTEAKPVAHTPTEDEAVKIVGAENVKRYWHPDTSSEAAELLASGDTNRAGTYNRLEEQGWKGRQVSLLLDVVDHFRQYPPPPATDETMEIEQITPNPAVKAEELSGSIGVISDAGGEPQFVAVRFPYNPDLIWRLKYHSGRQRWNAEKKQWQVPIQYAERIFELFPHFQRSPKATELEAQLRPHQG